MSTQSYVWYTVYGSNLSRQRFLCYIEGGKPTYGKSTNEGCKDKSRPLDARPYRVPYGLYFALPEGQTGTNNWCRGGVAFLNPCGERCENSWTLGRMWKITKEQYEEVKSQEGGSWYDSEIPLGEEDGIPIYTITNRVELTNVRAPSNAYLRTIALGLKETYNLTDEKIAGYLLEKPGVKGNFTIDKLIRVIAPATSIVDFV